MADILTQLQTCYDQLATQFYSTVCYLSQRHPIIAPEEVSDDPYTTQPAFGTLQPGPEDIDSGRPLRPDSPRTFVASQRELAQDLIIKGAQIEHLIRSLPGIGRFEEEQEARIRELEVQIREMEKQRKEKRREMRLLLKRLENVVMGVATSINYDEQMNGANGHS